MTIQEKRQKFMEMAVMGVVAQGGGSYDRDRGACLYSGPNGRHCHIGFFAPDLVEGDSIASNIWEGRCRGLDFVELGQTFLSELQAVHDSSCDVDGSGVFNWNHYSQKLHSLCHYFSLRYPGELL